MQFFLGLVFVVLAILGIARLVSDGDSYHPTDNYSWNQDCQYGNEYMATDGTIVKHSDCK